MIEAKLGDYILYNDSLGNEELGIIRKRTPDGKWLVEIVEDDNNTHGQKDFVESESIIKVVKE